MNITYLGTNNILNYSNIFQISISDPTVHVRWFDIPELISNNGKISLISSLFNTYGSLAVKINNINIQNQEYLNNKLLNFNHITGFMDYKGLVPPTADFINLNIINTKYTDPTYLQKVLIMPYYQNSIQSYTWTSSNIGQLKTFINQILTNYNNAYTKMGFIHNNTELTKFLIDSNNNIIINDFKHSFTDKTNNYSLLYQQYVNLLTNINTIGTINLSSVINYINGFITNNTQLNLQDVIDMINNLE